MQAAKTAVKEQGKDLAHILVVDDERSICELLEITFRKEGYRIEVAHNVESAKRKLESQIFDIVIIDSSPVLPVPDALSLGRWTDGAILVVRYDMSRFPLVDRARKRRRGQGNRGYPRFVARTSRRAALHAATCLALSRRGRGLLLRVL